MAAASLLIRDEEMTMRRLSTVAFMAALILAVPTGARAAVPERGSFDFGYESFVDQEVCAAAPWGFDVNATEHEYGTYQLFFDATGEITRIAIHLNYDATISANGKTLIERDTWTQFLTADGSRSVGATVLIRDAHGVVQRDAGQLVFDENGDLRLIRGPHDQILGGSFCPALAA
jgi:hypothetical protein